MTSVCFSRLHFRRRKRAMSYTAYKYKCGVAPRKTLARRERDNAKHCFVGVMVTRLPPKEKIAGSSPVRNGTFRIFFLKTICSRNGRSCHLSKSTQVLQAANQVLLFRKHALRLLYTITLYIHVSANVYTNAFV